MKKLKIAIGLVVLVIISYCVFHQCSILQYDSQIKEKYKLVESDKLHIYKLTYEDFIEKQENNTLDKPIIISRADCEHCITFFRRLNKGNSNKSINIYILESDKMSVSQKLDLENSLYISSVPTLIKVNSGSISEIYSGYISDDILESLS